MPTLNEWFDCRSQDGTPLPLEKCNADRRLYNLEPLPPDEQTERAITVAKTVEQSPKREVMQPLPSFRDRVSRFRNAITPHVAEGRPKCTQEQIDARLAICQECPQLDGRACRICGCRCNGNRTFLNKLAWADQECPHPDGPKWTRCDQAAGAESEGGHADPQRG